MKIPTKHINRDILEPYSINFNRKDFQSRGRATVFPIFSHDLYSQSPQYRGFSQDWLKQLTSFHEARLRVKDEEFARD
jgi:hypothetical protein